jgi:hypothetical protein
MLSKKSQTASRLISRRKTKHAMIVRRYAPRPVTKVTGEFIALRCLPPHIYKIAAPTARRICVQRCKKAFSTASVKMRNTRREQMFSALPRKPTCERSSTPKPAPLDPAAGAASRNNRPLRAQGRRGDHDGRSDRLLPHSAMPACREPRLSRRRRRNRLRLALPRKRAPVIGAAARQNSRSAIQRSLRSAASTVNFRHGLSSPSLVMRRCR